jgi:hypothetical protein
MMNDRPSDGQARGGSAGLCDRCVHVQQITSARGSIFYLCRLSITDARFPRYPRLPVLACPGYVPAETDDGRR